MAKKTKRLVISNSAKYRKFGKPKKKYERNSHSVMSKTQANKKAKTFREGNFNARVVKDGKGWNMYHFPTTKAVMKKGKKSRKKRVKRLPKMTPKRRKAIKKRETKYNKRYYPKSKKR